MELTEKAVGICPSCGEAVYNSREIDGPVWKCPTDLSPNNPYWLESPITEEEKERSGFYGNCPSEHGIDMGYCENYNHLPLHSKCYEKGEY